MEVEGDRKDSNGGQEHETLQLWRRDPVECLRELIGNPAFRDQMRFAPERAYEDKDGKSRLYDETWTGDWWWETQVSNHFRNHSELELTLDLAPFIG